MNPSYNEGPITVAALLDNDGDPIVDVDIPAYRCLVINPDEAAWQAAAATDILLAGVTMLQGERDGAVLVRLVGGGATVKVELDRGETAVVGSYLTLAVNGTVAIAEDGDLCFGQAVTGGTACVIEAILNRVPFELSVSS
jgi:hypothetical protein